MNALLQLCLGLGWERFQGSAGDSGIISKLIFSDKQVHMGVVGPGCFFRSGMFESICHLSWEVCTGLATVPPALMCKG